MKTEKNKIRKIDWEGFKKERPDLDCDEIKKVLEQSQALTNKIEAREAREKKARLKIEKHR